MGMKRDRKKGSRPEYEDLLYDETPSVVVYYPSRGGDDAGPEPTVRRDRSTAFVPDLAELEPMTREQPVIEVEQSQADPLIPGRGEPVLDPAKPVPASLQSRGLLAWDPTHRDPGEEEGFTAFFRPESDPGQPESNGMPASVGPSQGQAANGAAPAPVEPAPANRSAPAAVVPPAATQAPASSLRPVVFETDIIAADFIEADAIRADPVADPVAAPVRRTVIEERPVDQDDADLDAEADAESDADLDVDEGQDANGGLDGEPLDNQEDSAAFWKGFAAAPLAAVPEPTPRQANGQAPAPAEPAPAFGRPVEVNAPAEPAVRPAIALESGSPSEIEAQSRPAAPQADYASIDFDEPSTQMRFLQEWEAEVTGTTEAVVSANHTGRLFRSLRAHPQPQTLPALRRDQAARFRSLNSAQDSGPIPFSPRPAAAVLEVDDIVEPVNGQVLPLAPRDEPRTWKASSMSGMKPGLVYLIPLVATVLVGVANALLLGPGIGWPTGVALVVSSLVGALRIRLVDASVAVIAPPLAFLAAAATAGQIGMGLAGGPVIGAASNLFLALSANMPWLLGATLASLLVVVIRSRRDRA